MKVIVKRKLKIVRIFSRLNVGGPTLHVVNLTKVLADMGHETLLIVGSTEPGEKDWSDYAKSQGVQFIKIDELGPSIRPLRDLISFFKIYKIVKAFQPDVVHTHTFKAGVLGRIAAFLCKIPKVVHTYHGHLLSGYLSNYKLKILILIETTLAKITDHIITVSKIIKDDIVDAKIASREKVNVIELGFDMKLLTVELNKPSHLRQSLGISDEDTIIGTLGRMIPIKNYTLFLDSVLPLLKNNKKNHAVLIGDGPVKSDLIKHADKICNGDHELRSRIYFTGWITPFWRHLKSFDVYVCTSKNEGTSVSAIEAVMAKIPVISTCVGGMPDLLENGRIGKLVSSDADEIKNAIEDVIQLKNIPESPQTVQFKRQLEESSKSFTSRFDQDLLAEKVTSLYLQTKPLSISIIIALYNRKQFIAETIDSCLRQVHSEKVKIVVVDDGSTDGGADYIISKYGLSANLQPNTYSNDVIYLIKAKNNERGAARNTGAQFVQNHIQSEWLMFLDSDDVLAENSLLQFKKSIQKNYIKNAVAYYANSMIWYKDNSYRIKYTARQPSGNLFARMLAQNLMSQGATLIKASAFQTVGGYSEDRALSGSEDWHLHVRISNLGKIIYSQHISFYYRQHDENTSAQKLEKSILNSRQSMVDYIKSCFTNGTPIIDYMFANAYASIAGTYNSSGDRQMALKFLLMSLRRRPKFLLSRKFLLTAASVSKHTIKDKTLNRRENDILNP
jgi:glycosyltransferase involved in cell wall biosynthesis